MTEPQPERDPLEIVTLTAETLGRDILAALIEEIKRIPSSWEQLKSHDQQMAIERLAQRTRLVITEGLYLLFRGHYPACEATLEGIAIKKGLRVSLKIAKGARNWHEVVEAEGSQVLLVMADPAQFVERMDEIKAQADQKDLFKGDLWALEQAKNPDTAPGRPALATNAGSATSAGRRAGDRRPRRQSGRAAGDG